MFAGVACCLVRSFCSHRKWSETPVQVCEAFNGKNGDFEWLLEFDWCCDEFFLLLSGFSFSFWWRWRPLETFRWNCLFSIISVAMLRGRSEKYPPVPAIEHPPTVEWNKSSPTEPEIQRKKSSDDTEHSSRFRHNGEQQAPPSHWHTHPVCSFFHLHNPIRVSSWII